MPPTSSTSIFPPDADFLFRKVADPAKMSDNNPHMDPDIEICADETSLAQALAARVTPLTAMQRED